MHIQVLCGTRDRLPDAVDESHDGGRDRKIGPRFWSCWLKKVVEFYGLWWFMLDIAWKKKTYSIREVYKPTNMMDVYGDTTIVDGVYKLA